MSNTDTEKQGCPAPPTDAEVIEMLRERKRLDPDAPDMIALGVAAPPIGDKTHDPWLEAIKAVEEARDKWEAQGRKHWYPQVAQEVIGVIRARAAQFAVAKPIGQPIDAPVHNVSEPRVCVKCSHDPVKYSVNGECRAAVDSRLFKRTICGCRCQTSIDLTESQPRTSVPALTVDYEHDPETGEVFTVQVPVPEPPARIYIRPGSVEYSTMPMNFDNDDIEYVRLELIRKALEACEAGVINLGDCVEVRKSDYETLVASVKENHDGK